MVCAWMPRLSGFVAVEAVAFLAAHALTPRGRRCNHPRRAVLVPSIQTRDKASRDVELPVSGAIHARRPRTRIRDLPTFAV